MTCPVLTQTLRSIIVFIATSTLFGITAFADYPFTDDFEGGLGNWSAEEPWGTTTALHSSPVYSVTDSPSTFYGASVDASLALISPVDLLTATTPVLRFFHRYQIEDGYDFGLVEVSIDGGSVWAAPEASYSGSTPAWVREQIDLAAYVGQPDVRIRFRLVTDTTVPKDGWYIDDVVIAEGPGQVTLDTPITITTNSVDLTWSESLDADFSVYRIYRSTFPGFDWNTATLIAEIDDSTILGYTDITVTPKSTFYYRIMVLTSTDLHSVSAEVSATTPAGMDYPFLDDGEGTGTAWSADPTWTLTAENAFSGTHGWSDSPGGDYGDSIPSQSLTLISPVDLGSASEPVLSFAHDWTFAAGDSANVEISTDSGGSWTPLATYTNGTSGGWIRERFDLSAYALSSEVLVRFRTTTDASTGADGWYLDDISIAESPTVVDSPILDQITSHSMRLTWDRCNDLYFSHYAIHRSTSPGVGIQSTLVATISDQDITTFTDSGLALGIDYYYRVYAVSPYGTYSPDSAWESTAQTGGNPYPFSDDFEGSLENWNLTGDWGKTDVDQHGGTWSLNDSPGTNYENSSTSTAWTTIDLTGSTWPLLHFWDRHGLADDWGYLEVSTNGTSWTKLYATTSSRSTWREQQIDLSPWKNASNLWIRFTVSAGGSNFDEGWYIDDLSIAEHPGGVVTLPFFEDFETGTGSWLTSSWAPSTDDSHSGTMAARSTATGALINYSELSMELNGEIDLSGATDPQLTYWLRGEVGDDGGFTAQVSIDGGLNWTVLPGTSIPQYWTQDWTRYQISLDGYLQSGVRLRFRNTNGKYGSKSDLFIDDIAIEELPQPVYLNAPVPHLKSVDLSWEQSVLGDFDRYEVYRSTSSGVTVANTLIYSSTDSTDTAYTNTQLSIGATYYYRVFVFNSREVATPSNERSTTTVPLTFPFADPMENLGNWDATGTWGPDSTSPYEGTFSLNDSPGDNSALSSNTSILTAVNLSGSTWPVLRFWDRHGLANDWGYLEVSTNGTSWTKLYATTSSRSTWREQQIDLSPWKNETNLRIRFTVGTGGSDVDEGWYIDELSVADHPGVAVALPLFDDFETGTGNWLTSSWAPSTDDSHSGTMAARSTATGALINYSELSMELNGEIDLSGATDPQLTFWLKGAVGDDGGFAAQVSTDGGIIWINLPGTSVGQYWTGDWTRFQVSLSAYLQSGVGLRFRNTNGKYGGLSNLFVDDVSIEELPQPVYLDIPAPYLKSVDLSWEESALGDFDRYEVYRSASSGVTVANDLIYSSTDSADTSFTDTGLSIGATYYYRVFVFNTRDVVTPSNERTTTTVPLSFPFSDPMESLDNWDATGTWGPDGNSPYEGSFSLNDSPGDNSTPSTNTSILTAIDLTGSMWPVLRFWDRHGLANDWGYLEVSTNGTSWTKLYATTSSRSTWREQQIDLSPWKNETNLRIRFTVGTGGSDVDEGWYIDELSVADHPGVAVALPLFDDFETGTGNWLTSSWAPSTDDSHSGTMAARSTATGALINYSELSMELNGEIDLSVATNPQLTYWLKGAVGDDGGFAAQVSTDGGIIWINLPGTSVGQYWTGDWTRFQVSLNAYLQSGVRLRFRNTNGKYGGLSNLFVDDVNIGELPKTVTLATPDQVTISSMRLDWNNLNDPNFKAYAVYRSTSSTVNTDSELLTTITDQATTEFEVTALQARSTYYYRVYFIDNVDAYSPSNSTSGTTLGLTLPFNDDFEADTGVWTFTGDWGRITSAGVDDSWSLGDSPGDLTPSTDTWAITGVDLTGTSWPVLAFTERFDVPPSHWGLLEISSNGGSNWTTVYGVQESQADWTTRRFDLSPWREQGQVWIRFRFVASGSAPADGWHIDNLYIGENPIAGSSGYPFFDGFEDDVDNWLNGPWSLTDDDPYEGSTSILDTAGARIGNSELWLTYGSELDLSGATDPLLSLQVRGNTPDQNYFRGQVSTDGGINWQDLADIYIRDEQSLPDWTRMQTSLSGYQVTNLRIRFRVYGRYSGDSNIFLDNIAVGEQTPGAPTLNSPAWGADEPTVRPVLIVNNAVDYQSDFLTYEYQVFDDPGLTNIVADVPAIAGSSGTTSWPVDEDLAIDTQYWWRCRATDDSGNTGPWMDTATFFVQIDDHPPSVPVLLAPSDGSVIPDLTGRLTWLESTDPDEDNGDYVASYRVQVDDDPAFASPEADLADIATFVMATGAISVSLSELPGSGTLLTGTVYHWRVNAKDSKGVSSDWSAAPARFVFGADETAPACVIVSPIDDETVTDTPISVIGTASDDLSGADFVEVSTDGGATWTQAVGAGTWSHQWWPPLSADYQLSCRATDLSGNEGAAQTAITIHADLDRTMAFAESSASIHENGGTYNVIVTLSAARATEVTAELIVSGSATSGSDFDVPPQTIRFFPGQTTVSFPLTIADDDLDESDETVSLTLGNTNIPDVTIGAVGGLILTITDNDGSIFANGFE